MLKLQGSSSLRCFSRAAAPTRRIFLIAVQCSQALRRGFVQNADDMSRTDFLLRMTVELAGMSEKQALARWQRGHHAAASLQRALTARRGPQPSQAIAEYLSALNMLEESGAWPGPRDPVNERGVLEVRRRWARIQRRARASRSR